MKRKSSGFTIVELLIVIVIISILAALIITMYSGIQQRASNLQRISAAKEWQKLINTYVSQNGQYPSSTIGSHYCLGSGYPTDLDVNPDEDCNVSNSIKHPNPTADTAYATITNKLPQFPPKKLIGPSFTYVGLSLRAMDTFDPNGTPKATYPMLHYWLEGNNKDCMLRPVGQFIPGGYVVSSGTYTRNSDSFTQCVILLPDPATL